MTSPAVAPLETAAPAPPDDEPEDVPEDPEAVMVPLSGPPKRATTGVLDPPVSPVADCPRAWSNRGAGWPVVAGCHQPPSSPSRSGHVSSPSDHGNRSDLPCRMAMFRNSDPISG